MHADGSPVNRGSIEVSYKNWFHILLHYYWCYREEDKWIEAKLLLTELLIWLLKNMPVLWADTDQNLQCIMKREHLMIWAQLDNNSTIQDLELISQDITELQQAMWPIWAQNQYQSITTQLYTMDHQCQWCMAHLK